MQIDELKRKLSDFERVNKAQNSLNDHTSNLEQEMMRLKQKYVLFSDLGCKFNSRIVFAG